MNKQVEAIRAEIERRIANKIGNEHANPILRAELRGLLSFIDSLPEEQPEDFNDAFDKYMKEEWSHGTQLNDIARHFYELGQASVRMPEEQPEVGLDVTDFSKPLDPDVAKAIADNLYDMCDEQPSKDLKEAAMAQANPVLFGGKIVDYLESKYEAFIAGAEWQEKQDTADMLKSDFTVFNKCYEQGKKDIAKALLAKYKEEADKCPDADYDHDYTVAETQQYGRFMMMEDIYEEFCEPVGVTLDDLEDGQ